MTLKPAACRQDRSYAPLWTKIDLKYSIRLKNEPYFSAFEVSWVYE